MNSLTSGSCDDKPPSGTRIPRRWSGGGGAKRASALLRLILGGGVLGACEPTTYERLSVLGGGSGGAQVGAVKVFGDGSVAETTPSAVASGGAASNLDGTGTGGAGSSIDPAAGATGGTTTELPGSGGGAAASSATGGIAATSSGGGTGLAGTLGGGGTGGLLSGTGAATSTGGGAVASGGSGPGGSQSGGTTVTSSGGAPGSGGATGTGGGIAATDTAKYNFEATSQGWTIAVGTDPFTSIARSPTQHFAGAASLAGTLSAVAGKNYFLEVAPPAPAVPAGATVTFHVFIPAAAQLSAVRAYVLNENFALSYTDALAASLKRDAWTTITLAVPPAANNVIRLGVKLLSTGTWTGTVYVDSVDW